MTPSWWTDASKTLATALASDGYWRRYRADLNGTAGVHLGVFVAPYLDLILDGRKTIESRFGVQRCAPHGKVAVGDILVLKASAGPICGICRISETWFFDLRKTPLADVRRRFGRELCVDDSFWTLKADAQLATLMKVDHALALTPIHVAKKDRRGWVTVRERSPLFCAVRA